LLLALSRELSRVGRDRTSVVGQAARAWAVTAIPLAGRRVVGQ